MAGSPQVWTENVNLALDVAPKLKAGTVWMNCTNLFDAASGFGGYRESGFGREGGKEGLVEYLLPSWTKKAGGIDPWAPRARMNPVSWTPMKVQWPRPLGRPPAPTGHRDPCPPLTGPQSFFWAANSSGEMGRPLCR